MFTQAISSISQMLGLQSHIPVDYSIETVCIDSRYIPASSKTLFIAMKGKRIDSHVFIQDLYRRGVRCFITEVGYTADFVTSDAVFLAVDSPQAALQTIAAGQRQMFSAEAIAVTGSNGKTIVKEWLSHLLQPYIAVTKTPKSYNSQIGAPLSVLGLSPQSGIGIFEAGISQPYEMEALARIIQPTIGVFTNLGNSHQQNFDSLQHKLNEKIQLFQSCRTIIFCEDMPEVAVAIRSRYKDRTLISWTLTGKDAEANADIHKHDSKTDVTVSMNGSDTTFTIPFTDNSSIQNAISAFVGAKAVFPQQDFTAQLASLPQVEMRLNFVEGIRNSLLINDCYSSDLESIYAAVETLGQQKSKDKKIVIISDFDFPDQGKSSTLALLLDQLSKHKIDTLHFVSEKEQILPPKEFRILQYRSTKEFIASIRLHDFAESCILIKGSRYYTFEHIVKKLEKSAHQTVLEVNLSAIANNFSYFKKLLKPATKVMAMVKGYSYGSGDYEIAELLCSHKVDYLAVAFVDEGIVLREKGVSLPIAVMNPEVQNYAAMIDYMLEPEIYSINSLLRLLDETRFYSAESINIHLKIDTGMHRLGLEYPDLAELTAILHKHKWIHVVSVFSHLACADDPAHDAFTHLQAERFVKAANFIEQSIGYPVIKHLLNSPGTERFPHYQFDMVRLGIGIYGQSALPDKKLEHISTLKTIISQIRDVTAGETVGYSRKGIVPQSTRIGVLPIGYADGYDRRFSNGVGQVLINGILVPIIGNICMDACMVDLGTVQAEEGDEAILFSEHHPVSLLAQQIGTIPYEILTNVSKRVKRIYYQE